MNKILPIILVVVLSGCSSWWTHWVLIANTNGNLLHVDYNSIERNDNIVKFDLATTASESMKGDAGVEIKSDVSESVVNCKNNSYKRTLITLYSGPKASGKKWGSFKPKEQFKEFTKVYKGTAIYEVIKFVCP